MLEEVHPVPGDARNRGQPGLADPGALPELTGFATQPPRDVLGLAKAEGTETFLGWHRPSLHRSDYGAVTRGLRLGGHHGERGPHTRGARLHAGAQLILALLPIGCGLAHSRWPSHAGGCHSET
jgi:hypothetical protein